MRKKKKSIFDIRIPVWLEFVLLGATMLVFQTNIRGPLWALSMIIISLGAVAIVLWLLGSLLVFVAKHSPNSELAKGFNAGFSDAVEGGEITDNDERNIAIRHRTGAETYRIMKRMYSALLILLIVMQVELAVTLVFLAVRITGRALHARLYHKFSNEM